MKLNFKSKYLQPQNTCSSSCSVHHLLVSEKISVAEIGELTRGLKKILGTNERRANRKMYGKGPCTVLFPSGNLLNGDTSCYQWVDGDDAEKPVAVASLVMFCANRLRSYCLLILWPLTDALTNPISIDSTDIIRKVSGLEVIHPP